MRYSVETLAHNILNCYHAADWASQLAGSHWYRLEGERCEAFARRYDTISHLYGTQTRDSIAGAAAAISPGLRWDTIFSHLAALLTSHNVSVPTYSREFVRRARAILRGKLPIDVLHGDKTVAFYTLLVRAEPYDTEVVVDGHAWNIARGEYTVFRKRPGYAPPQKAVIWPARYRLCADAYRLAAKTLRLPPHEVQAATWIFWRKIHD